MPPGANEPRMALRCWGSGLAFPHCPLDFTAVRDHLPRLDLGFQDLTPHPAMRALDPRPVGTDRASEVVEGEAT